VDNALTFNPTALSGQWVANLLPGDHFIFADSSCGGFGAASINVPSVVKPEFQIRAQNVTSGGAAEIHTTTTPIAATVPLGARFTLSLQHAGPTPTSIVANFGIGLAGLTNAQADPALYPSSALLEFKAASSEDTKTFQAVHLGTQTVVITPDDSSLTRVVVAVKVVRPAKLGTTHQTVTLGSNSFDLDAKIIEWADKRGIPPQLIKGIMDRESASKFRPLEWRYEPLTTDWDDFAPPCPAFGLGVFVCQDGRSLQQFVPYRMEYDSAHPRGALLIDAEDVHPRSAFYSDFAQRIKIADSAQLVTAYAIVSENESWQNWIKILRSQSKHVLLDDPTMIQTALSWPANTTLASSYGLMQVLFAESFDNYGYVGIGGQRRPYYLFDVPTNVAGGGGSIPVGTGVYVFKYRKTNRFDKKRQFSPAYDTPAELDAHYLKGLMAYNGETCLRSDCYGPDTVSRIQNYLPVASSTIFP
jgi:hypothetical protein